MKKFSLECGVKASVDYMRNLPHAKNKVHTFSTANSWEKPFCSLQFELAVVWSYSAI